MKKIHTIFSAILLIVVLTVVFSVSVSADIGNAFDDGGGGYDNGWSNDWGDNSWDDDDDSYYNDYGDTSGDGIDLDSKTVLIALAIVVLLIIWKNKKQGGMDAARTVTQGDPNRANLYNEKETPEERVVAMIQETDPDFSLSSFKSFAEDCYLQLTEAWEKRDWEIARTFESDTLFNMHRKQLDEYIEQKKTNHMDSQCVLSKTLTSFHSDGKTETLIVKLNATLVDYVTDDETGDVISGSKTTRLNRWYRLEFIRTAGKKTSVDHDLTSHTCPNCAAPLTVTAAGRCEYCDSIITSGDYTWVLNAYGRWN